MVLDSLTGLGRCGFLSSGFVQNFQLWVGLLWSGLRFSGFGFLRSPAGGVCCWNILANWVKFLLGSLLGAEDLVSGTGFCWVWFWFLVFFLVVLAKPWCLISTSLESTVTNCCWFKCGCAFDFTGLGFGLGSWFGFFKFSRLNLGFFGVSIWVFWGFSFVLV